MIETLNSDCLYDMARRWYGYGRWEAPYWFIGPEPGQPEGDTLRERCKAWVDLGRGELIDCKDHHLRFGWAKWHQENPPLQPTWRPLILLLLAFLGKPRDSENVREYQKTRWGMKNDETCVIELSSLAAPNLAAPGEHGLFLKERIEEIRQRIHEYKPMFVLMYGLAQKPHWEAIAGGVFPSPDSIQRTGSTVSVFAPHPQTRGRTNSDWEKLAEQLRI